MLVEHVTAAPNPVYNKCGNGYYQVMEGGFYDIAVLRTFLLRHLCDALSVRHAAHWVQLFGILLPTVAY